MDLLVAVVTTELEKGGVAFKLSAEAFKKQEQHQGSVAGLEVAAKTMFERAQVIRSDSYKQALVANVEAMLQTMPQFQGKPVNPN